MTLAPIRKLTIVAKDPGLRVGEGGPMVFAQVDVPAEVLSAGPTGYRVKVVDYNATERRAYANRQIYQQGEELLDPFAPRANESLLDKRYQARVITNPNFHAQNCYAIAMRTLGLFERALGRRISWAFGGHQLHIAPHAFAIANAFYSEADRALMFGYLFVEEDKPIFTALSHDVVAHETTHAILDGLRSRYTEPSGPDQAAFHEGFSDVVAILSIFSLREVVAAGLGEEPRLPAAGERMAFIAAEKVTADAIRHSILLGIGRQIGLGSGGRPALRESALIAADPFILERPDMDEPHNRGEVLVAAVMQAFVGFWTSRIDQLGTFEGGRYNLSSVVDEGVKAASQLLQMMIRALDYCPPTDIDYPQFLASLLTADRELVPEDSRFGYRSTIKASFAAYGIVPPAADCDAEGCWLRFDETKILNYVRSNSEALTRDLDECFRFLWENLGPLEINDRGYTQVVSVDTSLRVDPDGIPFRENICQYIQMAHVFGSELMGIAGMRPLPEGLTTKSSVDLFGGGVIIFDQYGRVKYHIANRLFDGVRQRRRIEYLRDSGQLLTSKGDARNRFSNLHLARLEF